MPGFAGGQRPATYRIRIAGRLDQHWSSWFGGLALAQDGGTTTLTGMVPDQAALHGVLGKVRDLGAPLLSVERLEPVGDEGATDSAGGQEVAGEQRGRLNPACSTMCW